MVQYLTDITEILQSYTPRFKKDGQVCLMTRNNISHLIFMHSVIRMWWNKTASCWINTFMYCIALCSHKICNWNAGSYNGGNHTMAQKIQIDPPSHSCHEILRQYICLPVKNQRIEQHWNVHSWSDDTIPCEESTKLLTARKKSNQTK